MAQGDGRAPREAGREKERAESIRETGKKLSRENLRLHREVRIRRDAEARALRLSDENFWLRHALEVSEHGQKKLTARIAKLRAVRKTLSTSLSGMDLELRRALRRSRRQKSAIKSRSTENTRLRRHAKGSRNRTEALETEFAKLRSTGAVLSRRLYGRKSEQQKKPRSERKRGQQHGAPGHGCTQRPGSRSAPKYSPRRRRRASAHGADSPMHRTASRNPPSSRSRSRLTSAWSSADAFAGPASARPRRWKCPRPPGGAAVPRHALRNHLLGALALRTLCRPAPGAPHRGMDVGPGG